jgi:hypothetical protein
MRRILRDRQVTRFKKIENKTTVTIFAKKSLDINIIPNPVYNGLF